MNTNKHADVIEKKEQLDAITAQLKTRFIGLDTIIDNVMNLVTSWYLFPQAQMRPCIINLWGLTGSGKTALVRTLVELLGHRKLFIHFDMGEFESDSASSIRRIFTEDL